MNELRTGELLMVEVARCRVEPVEAFKVPRDLEPGDEGSGGAEETSPRGTAANPARASVTSEIRVIAGVVRR
jgi:hypothetical protein